MLTDPSVSYQQYIKDWGIFCRFIELKFAIKQGRVQRWNDSRTDTCFVFIFPLFYSLLEISFSIKTKMSPARNLLKVFIF